MGAWKNTAAMIVVLGIVTFVPVEAVSCVLSPQRSQIMSEIEEYMITGDVTGAQDYLTAIRDEHDLPPVDRAFIERWIERINNISLVTPTAFAQLEKHVGRDIALSKRGVTYHGRLIDFDRVDETLILAIRSDVSIQIAFTDLRSRELTRWASKAVSLTPTEVFLFHFYRGDHRDARRALRRLDFFEEKEFFQDRLTAARAPAGTNVPINEKTDPSRRATVSDRRIEWSLPSGASREVCEAIMSGLDWLVRHQHPAGYWDCDGYNRFCTTERCSTQGKALNDVGVTALALLALIHSGVTLDDGPCSEPLRIGTDYLLDIQDEEDGSFGPHAGMHWVFNQAIASLAIIEAGGRFDAPRLTESAQRALDFVHRNKNPGKAWRYNNPELDGQFKNDTSVTGWMIMCLVAADRYDLAYNKVDLEEALVFIDEMTNPDTGRTGYKECGTYSARIFGTQKRWPFGKGETLTAVAIYCRSQACEIFCDTESHADAIAAGAKLLRVNPPKWSVAEGTIDFHYWYFGSLFLASEVRTGIGKPAGWYHAHEKDWVNWTRAARKALVENQEKHGCARGSWDAAVDPWGVAGGKVYATAMNLLTLEISFEEALR